MACTAWSSRVWARYRALRFGRLETPSQALTLMSVWVGPISMYRLALWLAQARTQAKRNDFV